MKMIPSLKLVTVTASAALVALLITPALSPLAGDRFMKADGPAPGGAAEANGPLADKISLVHGAIAGTAPGSPATREAWPAGERWSRTSASDREFRHLLLTLHKGAKPAPEKRSLLRMIGDYLTLSGTRSNGQVEEVVLDPEFGEISMELDLRLGRPHSISGGESASERANDSMLRTFEASLLADIETTAPADTAPTVSDYARAPIGINTSSAEGGTLVISGQSLSSWTSSGTNARVGYVPPAPAWYGLSPSAPLNATYSAGSFTVGSVVMTAPVNVPPAPNWNSFVPPAPAGNWNSGPAPQQFASLPSYPTVAPSTATVLSSAKTAAVVNRSVPAPVSSSALTTSFVSASSPAASLTVQPQIPQNNFIFVGDVSGNAVKEYNATSTGSPLLTINLPANSEEISVAVAGTSLYVADFGTGQVTAYSIASGTLGQPLAGFTTITGLQPNAVTLTSNGLNLYVASGNGTGTSTVKEYNALTGALISGGVFTPISAGWAYSLTLSTDNTKLYVGDAGNQDGTAPTSVKEYNASNGALIGAFSLSGTVDNLFPGGLAMTASGQNLLVVNESADPAGNVQEYNATTGTQVAFSLSPGETDSNEPTNIVSFGNTMYISDEGQANVTEYTYTTSTGTQVSTGTFDITGVDPYGLAIIPEPSTGLLLLASGAMFLVRRRRVEGGARMVRG